MKALQEKAAKALHDARAIMDAADKEGRGLTAEELTKYDAYMAEFDAAQESIRRAAKLAEAEKAIASEGPIAGRSVESHIVQPVGFGSPEYRDAFSRFIRSGGRAVEDRVMAFGTDTAGGIFVPDEFKNSIIAARLQSNVMRKLATIFTTSTGVMTIPSVTAHGTADWALENGTYNNTDDTTAGVTLNAYKLTRETDVSEELLADSAFPIEPYLANSFGVALGVAEETAFFTGNGSGKPTGVVGASTLGKTASATNAITADELMDTFYACPRQYRSAPKAAWVMHDSTIKAIRKLVTGVSGDKTYLWAPGLQAGEPDTLLGKPVYAQADMDQLASGKKVALFGDFSYYLIGDRQGISVSADPYTLKRNGQVAFYGSIRTDGKLSLATAIYHLITA